MSPTSAHRASRVLGLALTATLVGAPLAGTAAAAAPAAPAATDARHHPRMQVRFVSIGCVGDTLSGRVRVKSRTRSTLKLSLLAGRNKRHLVATGQSETERIRVGTRKYRFTFDLAGRSDEVYRVVAVDPRGRVLAHSALMAASACEPGSEVPEAPAAALVPLSLLGTLGGAMVIRRRRAGRGAGSAAA